ncbi:hypothetical protein SFC07_11615 [Corynebacterium callunae]|uniref:hypothetical protein n=1 Tax=Corynebacterium callunae TaxID=1721 RepID=UPI003982AF27
MHTAIDAGIMRAVVDETTRRVKSDDRLVYFQSGELVQQAWVAEAALAQAARGVDGVVAGEVDAQAAALGVAAARSWIAKAAVEVASGRYELLGASQATQDSGMDIFWRDLRTHTLHDKRREKLEILGKTAISGELSQLGTKM